MQDQIHYRNDYQIWYLLITILLLILPFISLIFVPKNGPNTVESPQLSQRINGGHSIQQTISQAEVDSQD